MQSWQDIADDKCPVCSEPRFYRVAGRLKPRREMFLFCPKAAVASWFADKEFNNLLFSHVDVSKLAYRQSVDFKRINAGDVQHRQWPPGMLSDPNTILVAIAADGHHVFGSSTQGHTGEGCLMLIAFLC